LLKFKKTPLKRNELTGSYRLPAQTAFLFLTLRFLNFLTHFVQGRYIRVIYSSPLVFPPSSKFLIPTNQIIYFSPLVSFKSTDSPTHPIPNSTISFSPLVQNVYTQIKIPIFNSVIESLGSVEAFFDDISVEHIESKVTQVADLLSVWDADQADQYGCDESSCE
jgi:hypothetical protein